MFRCPAERNKNVDGLECRVGQVPHGLTTAATELGIVNAFSRVLLDRLLALVLLVLRI